MGKLEKTNLVSLEGRDVLSSVKSLVSALSKANNISLGFETGRRYARIYRIVGEDNRSAYAFVDLKGGKTKGIPSSVGDIYKPGGWKVPAKWARGSVFSDDGGLSAFSKYGVKNLKSGFHR